MMVVSDTTVGNMELRNLFIQLSFKYAELRKYSFAQVKSALVRLLNHQSGQLLLTVPEPFTIGGWDKQAILTLTEFID